MSSHIDMHSHTAPHPGPSPCSFLLVGLSAVAKGESQRWKPYPRLRVRIWSLTFWPQGLCMPRSWTICLPTLVPIAQSVFLLQHGQTHKQTDTTKRSTPRLGTSRGAVILCGWECNRRPGGK